jgi:hypothetical protein
MFEKARDLVAGKEATKETLEILEGISDNFVKEFKRIVEISDRLKSSVKNCKTINKELMKSILATDVLNRSESKVINSSYYLCLKNLEIARNHQRNALMKLSQIPDVQQTESLISDSIEFLNLSFGFILKSLKFLKGIK